MRTISLFVPGVPMNANDRGRWAIINDRAHFREEWGKAGLVVKRKWGPPAERARIVAAHVYTVNRIRDPLGLAERLKAPVDGLVDAGLLAGDDEDHIEVLLSRSIRSTVAGLVIKIEELPT